MGKNFCCLKENQGEMKSKVISHSKKKKNKLINTQNIDYTVSRNGFMSTLFFPHLSFLKKKIIDLEISLSPASK